MDYVWCPFNSEHKVRGTELRMHMATCQSMPVEKPAEPHLPKKKTNWNTMLPNPTRNVEVETRFYASQDPEKLLQCPYDSNHQIRACRFPYHLIKCKKNHTDIAMQLATCPFNARHLVPRAELSRHILSCDDRSCIEQDIAGEKSYYQRDASPCTWKTPPCEEDWDKDLQNNKATFMWGIPSYPVPSTSGTNILMDAKNSLGSGLRAPKSMPYILPWKMHTDTKRE